MKILMLVMLILALGAVESHIVVAMVLIAITAATKEVIKHYSSRVPFFKGFNQVFADRVLFNEFITHLGYLKLS